MFQDPILSEEEEQLLEEMALITPGILHINRITDFSVEFMSRKGQELLGYSLQEFRQDGAGLLRRHQSSFTCNTLHPSISRKLVLAEKRQVLTYVQDWRKEEEGEPILFVTTTGLLNKDLLLSTSYFPGETEFLTLGMGKPPESLPFYTRYFGAYKKLTRREREIMNLLGRDYSRRAIAEKLFIDETTVKKHCENIYRKLGTHKRTEIGRISLAFNDLLG